MAFNFDDHYARLLASMDEVVLLMSQHGADFWSSRISELRERLGEHDAYALDLLLTCFGGMGSWTDLVIHARNGHTVEDEEAVEVNERLAALRGDVYRHAHSLHHELRSSD